MLKTHRIHQLYIANNTLSTIYELILYIITILGFIRTQGIRKEKKTKGKLNS